jgi:penicillin-binding protein 1A
LHDLWGERSQTVSEALWAERTGTNPPAAGTRFQHWQHLRHRHMPDTGTRRTAKITQPLGEEPEPAALPQQPAPDETGQRSVSGKRPKVTRPVPPEEPVLSLQLLPVRVSLPAVIEPEETALEPVPEERALMLPEAPERAVRIVTPPGLPAPGAPLPGRPYTRAQVLRRHWKRERLHASTWRYRRQQRRVGLGLFAGILVPVTLAMMVVLSLAGIALLYYAYEQAQLAALATELPKDSLKVYDAQGDLIFELGDEGLQTTVSLDQVSLNVINATTAIEDKDFWQNQGVDFLAVVRAASDDLRSGQVVSGASTITQQLIKNALVGPAPTFDRKLREMILALGVTQEYSKQQILTFYLNTIYYGEQAYGIDAAAHVYFNLTDSPQHTAASQLDLAQAAMLAGLPRAPSAYDPVVNLQQALDRQKTVLDQMVVAGYITTGEAILAEQEAARPGFIHPGHATNLIPSVSNYVMSELQQLMDSGQIPSGILSRSGLQVMTTLNLPLQQQMLKIAQAHINQMRAAHHMSDASVVMIDYHTGAIEVMVGSINPRSQFNVAAQGYRQPGSSFKPFVYATAFEKGWSPGTAISDTPVHIFVSEGEPIYSPVNYDLRFHGEMTLRHALQNSFNVPAVRTEMFAGIKQSLATAEVMGITSYLGTPAPSMVLGGLSVHLLDETSAYGVFADGGIRMPPHMIQEIRDSQGKIIYQYHAMGARVISPQVAGLITNVLSDDKERQYEFGVCSPLMLYDGTPYSAACQSGHTGVVRPAATKTGTTGDFKDNWTVGYTSDYVIGVWAGNDNGDPMVNVSGVDGAAPIWHDSMLLAERGHPIVPFTLPHGLVRATVHYADGVTSTDWYLPGTVPPGGVIVGVS